MANSKRKCKQCEAYVLVETGVKVRIGFFCSMGHVIDFANEKVDRDRKKATEKLIADTKRKNAKQKRDFYDNDLKTRKAAAKKACHLYIRTRDKGEACICCGRPLGKNFDAGHFLESGNNSFLRYHEDNIHAQSVYCNQYKGGNSDDYEGRLRKKIGDERVDWLLDNKNKIVKRTAQDYKEIENYFKSKINEEFEC